MFAQAPSGFKLMPSGVSLLRKVFLTTCNAPVRVATVALLVAEALATLTVGGSIDLLLEVDLACCTLCIRVY
jgi:hypothetical protein